MKPARFPRPLVILGACAFLVTVFSGIVVVRQEIVRRSATFEYQAYQVLTGIVERYASGESFDPARWPEVSGFGLYGPAGRSLYRFGSAPEALNTQDIPESFSSGASNGVTGSSLIVIRRLGAIPTSMGRASEMMRRFMPPRGEVGEGDKGSDDRDERDEQRPEPPKERSSNDPSGMGLGMGPGSGTGLGPGMGRAGAGPMSALMARYAFIELNVATGLRSSRLFVLLVVAFLALFLVAAFVLIDYARKLAAYREREHSTAHLVQLGEAARTLAHEIKNPLGVIRVQCATLDRTLPAGFEENVAIIREETDRLVTLTDRVREFLRNSEGSPVRCEASEFLDRCRARYGERLLVPAWQGAPAFVTVDPDRMTQVLDNLIANAFDAIERAGKSDSLPCLTAGVAKGSVSFQVSDRGCGVAPENRPRLFELFFTTKPKGSGIGLALSRRYMEQAGGSLDYHEQPGGGSVFTARLPGSDA